jgi:hypothetical protein
MSAQDQFHTLSDRATKAEENVKTASAKNMDDLRKRVQAAGDLAQKHATDLKTHATNAKQKASDGWTDVQDRWSGHVALVRTDAGDRKEQRDSKRAQHHAERAERYAADTVEFAFAAIEESEYAVLDATLAVA